MNRRIDINCDMGESYGRFQIGQDNAIFPWITSCNVACGFHGGDPLHIEKTIEKALANGLQIGAHPSYPDLVGFGRRKMDIPPSELKALVKYQIAAVKGITESMGGILSYVKPHGALYKSAADKEKEALAIVQAIKEMDPALALLGMAATYMEKAALEEGIRFISEAFADRRYQDNGRLVSRKLPLAVIADPQKAAEQMLSIALNQQVLSETGKAISLKAQSFCIHGDNPAAVEILKAIDVAINENGLKKHHF